MLLSDNARTIIDLRYSRKDENGAPTETPEQVVTRVASNVAIVSALYKDQPSKDSLIINQGKFPYRTAVRAYEWLLDKHGDMWDDERGFNATIARGWDAYLEQKGKYVDLLTNRYMLPNSPTWTGAGTPLGQLAACFVLPVDDDLGRTRTSIFETLKVAALIQQTGGGNGFDFSRLRPSNSIVKTSMGRASGPVGFMDAYNACIIIIAQGGSRRGANMGVLRCDHPDVFGFVKAKVEEGRISAFNISVAITDKFMEAVESNDTFDLIFGGKVYETIQARDLFDMITEDAWKIGDPGCLFIDRANRDNPCPQRYTLESTNPCGEQWLPPYGTCTLGAIALQRFVQDIRSIPSINWAHLAEAVHTSMQFLDDVVDANQYVRGVPEVAEMAQNERRVGLGLMGVADTLAILGIRYGSLEAQEFLAQVTEFCRYHSMLASIDRAKERGSFPWIDGSIYDPEDLKSYGQGAIMPKKDSDELYFLWQAPSSAIGTVGNKWNRPKLNWDDIYQGITDYGIRNACQFNFHPTGTTSQIADCEGSGIEPFFALIYERTLTQEDKPITLYYASPLFNSALEYAGFTSDQISSICKEIKANKGSCQGLASVPINIQNAFVVAADIAPTNHVRMQAAAQVYTDNSISKTINFPNGATVEDVRDVYLLAHKLGCKGITIYRQGSRQVEVLKVTEVKEEEPKVIAPIDTWPVIHPMPLPATAETHGISARVFPVKTAFGTLQVTITEHAQYPGRPFDIRASVGKGGSDKNADVEALGRAISLATRAGVAIEDVVDQLVGVGGRTFSGFGPKRSHSVADAIGKLLQRLYVEEDEDHFAEEDWPVEVKKVAEQVLADLSMVCPECKNATVVNESGCRHCDVRIGGCGRYNACD